MKENPLKRIDPIIKAIEIGLENWVRTKCESLDTLSLELSGSSLQLLQGKVTGVKLSASKCIFQGLNFHHAEIESGPIQIKINFSMKGQRVKLEEAFYIKGNLSLIGNELSQALISGQWQGVGDLVAEKLLGVKSLESLSIQNDLLEIKGRDPNNNELILGRFNIDAAGGNLRINPLNKQAMILILPMDPSIKINSAMLKGGKLWITGWSEVNP